jgi:alpha-tubulin suppressor-like RCC1 family protein
VDPEVAKMTAGFLLRVRRPLLPFLLACSWCLGVLPGQSSIRGWADLVYDTESRSGRVFHIAAAADSTVVVRHDQRIFVQGSMAGVSFLYPPAVPAPLRVVDLESGNNHGLALLSDGQILAWGWLAASVPALPPGLRYTQVSSGYSFAAAVRSDGAVLAWGVNTAGQCNVPVMPAGLTVTQLSAGHAHAAVLLSDGSILVWGNATVGVQNVPPLPPGTRYVGLDGGGEHMLAKRSDGVLVAWGDNTFGQCNVPPLPPGTEYTIYRADFFQCTALRSDQVLVTWGATIGYGLDTPPPIPPGDRCIDIATGTNHSVALLRSGEVLTWGDQVFMQGDLARLPAGLDSRGRPYRFQSMSTGSYHALAVLSDGSLQQWGAPFGPPPALPPGVRYVHAEASPYHNAALRTDGQLVAWGSNAHGQCNVPPLPPGTEYTKVGLSHTHSVALRSDGAAVAFGQNNKGQCTIPPLPAGISYVDVDASYWGTLLVRSDGQAVYAGTTTNSQHVIPPLPAGLHYARVAALRNSCVALRSDGTAVPWGAPFWTPIPTLPWGVAYVELAGGERHVALRRSDGQIVVAGVLQFYQDAVPPLDPGTSYVQISAEEDVSAARVGPTSTFVSYAPGCAGSLPASRLVPADTPRLGQTLQVRLFDLPQHLAILAFGWNAIAPLDLGFVGMPGCSLHVDPAAFVPLVGQGQQAVWEVAVPDAPPFLGVRFYAQALVLDSGAPNGFGAVVGDAAEAVIGDS